MIRKAIVEDIDWIVHAGYDMCSLLGSPELYNPKHLADTFIPYVMENGIVLVDDQKMGVIGGIVMHHMYNPEKSLLVELMWCVHEGKRGSSLGYRLLKAFEEEGIKSEVNYIQMSLMESSTVTSMEKQGYRRKEFALIKEMSISLGIKQTWQSSMTFADVARPILPTEEQILPVLEQVGDEVLRRVTEGR